MDHRFDAGDDNWRGALDTAGPADVFGNVFQNRIRVVAFTKETAIDRFQPAAAVGKDRECRCRQDQEQKRPRRLSTE